MGAQSQNTAVDPTARAYNWTDQKAFAKAQALLAVDATASRMYHLPNQTYISKNKKKKRQFTWTDWENFRIEEDQFVYGLREILKSKTFEYLIMLIILANVVCIAIETDQSLSELGERNQNIFLTFDLFFLGVYLFEFLAKVYVWPIGYWKDHYNKFDFLILIISFMQWILGFTSLTWQDPELLKVLKAFRSFRAFRAVSFIKSLQVLVTALYVTIFKNAVNIFALLFLMMFIFGVLGHYIFGLDGTAATRADWGTLGDAIYTLWCYVVADNWYPTQEALVDAGFQGSQIYTAIFIFIGNIIVTNLFIGVICMNIDEATQADNEYKRKKREQHRLMKRDIFLKKQRADLTQLVQKTSKKTNMQDLLQELAGRLRHEDVVPMNAISCDPMWMEAFLTTLNYQENTMYRAQQLQFGLANILAEIADRKMKSVVDQD